MNIKVCNNSRLYGRYIVAYSQSRDQVSQYIVLLASPADHDTITLVVVGCNATVQVARALKHLKHVRAVVFEAELAVFEEDLATNHIVLS